MWFACVMMLYAYRVIFAKICHPLVFFVFLLVYLQSDYYCQTFIALITFFCAKVWLAHAVLSVEKSQGVSTRSGYWVGICSPRHK